MDSWPRQMNQTIDRLRRASTVTELPSAVPLRLGLSQRPSTLALVPQSSTTTAQRRKSDSSNSDVRASDALDQFHSRRTVQPSPLRNETEATNEFGSSTSSELLSKSSGSEIEEHRLEIGPVIPSVIITQPDNTLKSRCSKGRFLFLEEEVSIQSPIGIGQDRSSPDKASNGPALGTLIMFASEPLSSRTKQQPDPGQLDVEHNSKDLQAPTPMDFPVSSLIASDPTQAVKGTSPVKISTPPVNETSVNGVALSNSRPKLRRRAIGRVRKLILHKQVLSILFGRQRVGIIHSALGTSETRSQRNQIPNLDGAMPPMMPDPAGIVMHVLSSSESVQIDNMGAPQPSRRVSIISPLNPTGNLNQRQLEPEDIAAKPGGPQKLRARQRPVLLPTLADKVRLSRSGKKTKEFPAHPEGSLAAGAYTWKKKKSWKNRMLPPRLRTLGSLFGKRKTSQKSRSWRFWKSASRTSKRADNKENPKARR